MSSENNQEATFPQTITLRANCCSDLPHWIRNGLNPKSVALSNAHTQADAGVSISIIGEFPFDFDAMSNTIVVKRYFSDGERNSYKNGYLGIIVTCNTCDNMTFHYFYEGRWYTTNEHAGYRRQVTISWDDDLPKDKRTWRNITSVRYCISRNWESYDDRSVNCFGKLPKTLINHDNYRLDNSTGSVSMGLIDEFWEFYLDAYRNYSNDGFKRKFSMWSAEMANAYQRVMIGLQERCERSDEHIEALANAAISAARTIYGFKDVDLSTSKPVRSRKLQAARKQLEDALKSAHFNPIIYDQDKKPVV